MIRIPFPFTISKAENVLTSVDPHNIVLEQYIDLNGVMRGIHHSYSKSDTLIKYSKKENSPVSPTPSNELHLGTPKFYGNSNLTSLDRDDSEGKFPDILNWNRRDSEWMENMKRRFMQISPAVHGNLKFKATLQLPDHYLLFCVSIDPVLNHKREEQMQLTNPCYNFMTTIEDPYSFAKQLGIDVRKQLNTISTIVSHGPVVYLDDEDKVSEFYTRSRERFSDLFPFNQHLPLFIKEKAKYEVQQEYRFVVNTPLYRHREDHILLNISDDLRALLFPVT